MNASEIDSLQERIFRLLDGEMDVNEAAALDAELLHDKEARSIYLQLSALHSTLEHQHASRSEIGHSSIIPIDRFLARQRVKTVQFSALAAAAIVMICGLLFWSIYAKEPKTIASFQSSPDSEFVVSQNNKSNTSSDQSMRPGSRLRLSSGTIEATFASGVRCILDAPCEVTFQDDNRISLTHGVGLFQVPKGVSGFTVDTRSLKIVDLGTAFGIVAKRNGFDEVHVTQGSVEISILKSKSKERKEILKAGSARRFDESGKIIPTKYDASRFPTQLIKPLKIRNAGFEESELTASKPDEVGYGPVHGWAASGAGVGHNRFSQPFLMQPAHDGEHVAFIQGNGIISQTVSGFDPTKLYSVTYFVNERGLPEAATRTAVSLDFGTSSFSPLHPVRKTDAFRRIVSGPLSVFGPSANIQISAQKTSGDASLLIDSVSIARAVPAIQDGGFEFPVQPRTAFKQANGTGTGSLAKSTWKYFGGAGITANNSDFSPQLSPEGSQAAVLQNNASIETIIHEFEPGVSYRLNLKAAGRKHEGAANFQVLLDGKPLTFEDLEIILPTAKTYQSFASDIFTTNGGSIPLLIKNTSSGTSFIDDIHFEFVAEAE